MATTFSAEELSAETGISVDRLRWFVTIGIIRPRRPEPRSERPKTL